MAIFKGGKGRNDHFVGTDAVDRFVFDPADLTGMDTIVGGGGAGIDTLAFTRPGTIEAAMLAGVSGVERIELGAGSNRVVVDDALVRTAVNARVTVVGGGDDTVDASALTGVDAVVVVAGGGADMLTAGAGDDVFDFASGTLTAADTVTGGRGIDTLVLGDQAKITAAMLAHVRMVERVQLADSGTAIALDLGMAYQLDDRLQILGGRGNDVFDVRSFARVMTGNPLILNGGAGDDVVRGTGDTMSDSQPGSGYRFDGGTGADSIDAQGAGYSTVVYDRGDVQALVSGGTLIVVGRATIDLSGRDDQTVGDTCVVRGFTDVDASASMHGVNVVSGRGGTLVGGAGDDTLTGGRYIRGGLGADTMIGSKDFPGIQFYIGEGEFASGEAVLGLTGNDFLDIVGGADLTTGTVTGIRYLTLHSGLSGPGTLIMGSDQVDDLAYFDGEGQLIIRIGDDHSLELTGISAVNIDVRIEATAGNDIITTTDDFVAHGGGGADVISGSREIYGDGGDDILTYPDYTSDRIIDGGRGGDTLKSPGAGTSDTLVLRLANLTDQSLDDHAVVRGMEHVDYSLSVYDIHCIGSDGRNRLFGGDGYDRIFGGAGDDLIGGGTGIDILAGGAGADVIDGGYEADKLTGGAGFDRFTFTTSAQPDSSTYDEIDVVTDFAASEDTLAFARKDSDGNSLYTVTGGKFDTLIEATSRSVDLRSADLVIYTAGIFDDGEEVRTWLQDNGTAGRNQHLFVAAQNSDHHTLLYYVSDGSGTFYHSTYAVADLGRVAVTELTLADFTLI